MLNELQKYITDPEVLNHYMMRYLIDVKEIDGDFGETLLEMKYKIPLYTNYFETNIECNNIVLKLTSDGNALDLTKAEVTESSNWYFKPMINDNINFYTHPAMQIITEKINGVEIPKLDLFSMAEQLRIVLERVNSYIYHNKSMTFFTDQSIFRYPIELEKTKIQIFYIESGNEPYYQTITLRKFIK